ncbi:Stf0 family sulfotransferase [Dyella sp.]|jgi:LPS sulfotransferase NodH|uniref:Stf0 family sulfotransferase n=1 Tax=Dyella sp. TaxID=1869338 RepID=UPI002FD9F73E
MIASTPHKAIQDVHVTNRLYSAEMDFNCFGQDPIGSYMLATIPRSGSTYCAIRLWQTGLLGAPMEYLNFRVIGSLLRRLGYQVSDMGYVPIQMMSAYWSDIQRLRSSANGMFGYKMFTSNYVAIARHSPNFLKEITPQYVVYLTRQDVIGQAISYSRALRSKVWFAGVADTPAVDYDYAHIKDALCSIGEQKAAWERVFEMTGAEPIRITYEDLMTTSSTVIDHILNAMGVKPDESRAISVPMIDRQTDGVSKEWRERFTEDSLDDAEVEAIQV